MKKQTAVEWLENKLDIIFPLEFEWDKLNNIFQQAKEIEKEQHLNTWNDGMKSDNGYFGNFEQYYNETFIKD